MTPEREAILRKLKDAAAASRAKREEEAARREKQLANVPLAGPVEQEEAEENTAAKFGNITFNERQLEAVELAREGKEFCLIGAAGTGKTTTIKAIIHYLIANLCLELDTDVWGIPQKSILLGSFTNRAVKNIAKAVSDVNGASKFCSTIHSFLEFKPSEEEVIDEESGEAKSLFRFRPTYDKENQLPDTKLIIVEEASMVGIDLFKQLIDACPNAKFIFLGDLNQLPPVFGDPILGHKLNELPVVELETVYRQAMDSPIIAFQHNFTLKGLLPGETQLEKISTESSGQLVFHPLRNEKKIDPEVMAQLIAHHMTTLYEAGEYNFENSIILIPYNKSFGTVIMNKYIAQYFSSKVNMEPVYEIYAGMETQYLAVGDFVVWNKEEYLISEISENKQYFGERHPRQPSLTMDRFGHDENSTEASDILAQFDVKNVNAEQDLAMLLRTTDGDLQEDVEELKAQSSHTVKLIRPHWLLREGQSDEGPELSTRGDINKLELGYAITVHKSQGSEWENVFLIMSNKHRAMLNRELLYTGMTRARKRLKVMYSAQSLPGKKDSSVCKAIKNQRIKGKTWREKAKHFFDRRDQFNAKMDDSYEQAAKD